MTSTEDLRKAVAEDDGSLPERWNPDDEPGTTLIGILTRYEAIVTEFGESQIAVLEDADDGTEWGVALFRSVLRNRFEKLKPAIGDTVGVKYVGLVEPRTKDGRPYHNYVVRVMRNTAAPSATTTTAAATAAGDGDDELPF